MDYPVAVQVVAVPQVAVAVMPNGAAVQVVPGAVAVPSARVRVNSGQKVHVKVKPKSVVYSQPYINQFSISQVPDDPMPQRINFTTHDFLIGAGVIVGLVVGTLAVVAIHDFLWIPYEYRFKHWASRTWRRFYDLSFSSDS